MKLVLLVRRQTETIQTVDGAIMKVRAVSVGRSKQARSFHEATSFGEVTGVALVAEGRDGLTALPQDPRLEVGIIRVLREYHAKQVMTFNCYAFANMVYGLQPHTSKQQSRYWQTKKHTGHLRIGEVVFLVTSQLGIFHHAAIYLGRGLYISIYGAGGDLEVATLRQMKESYLAAQVLVARPKAVH